MKTNTHPQSLKSLAFATAAAFALAASPALKADDESGENLAREAVITSEQTSSAAFSNIRHLNDNNTYSIWRGTVPAEVVIDLGDVKKVGRVDLHIPSNFITPRNQELGVSVSDDGEKYEDVVDFARRAFTAGNGGRVSIPLDRQTRYVKVTIESNDQDEGEAMLSEIRIYE